MRNIAFLPKNHITISLILLFIAVILFAVTNPFIKNKGNSNISVKGIKEVNSIQTSNQLKPSIKSFQSITPIQEENLPLSPTVSPVPSDKPASTATPSISVSPAPNYITVNLSGQVYNDFNCNNVKEADETILSGITIAILQPQDSVILQILTSDTNGKYLFSKTIQENDSLTIQPVPGINMVFAPKEVTLSSGNKSAVIDLSSCP